MRLGMMQPYFFPYAGYFALIAATDQWVVFDTAQYIRRGWVHRNRILSGGDSDWKYLRLPVCKAPQTTMICQMQISRPPELATVITRQLDEYRCWRPPFYEETRELLENCLSNTDSDLTSLLIRCLQLTCDHLRIRFDPVRFSELPVRLPEQPQPGDWALATAVHLQASEYINPPGGRELFDPAAFRRDGIRLAFLNHQLPAYDQRNDRYVAGLSVIDALMWIGREQTRRMIDDYELTEARPVAA